MYSVTVTTSTPGSANYCVELPTPSIYAEAMFYQSVADSSPFLFVEGTTTQGTSNRPQRAPTNVFKAEDDIGDCGVCLETIAKGQTFRRLPCSSSFNHCFHKPCIDRWLNTSRTCPMCRALIS